VAFFESTNQLGELTNSPWTLVWSNAPIGNYQLKAVAIDNDGGTAESDPVVIIIVSNQPPSISLLAPTNGQVFFRPSDILLETSASDPDGFISLVEFFEGGNKLGESTNAPFSFVWSNAPLGAFTFTAVANDDSGGQTISSSVSVQVARSLPLITISTPIQLGETFIFSFLTKADWSYAVEYANSPISTQWSTVTNFVGDGSAVFVTNNLSFISNNFYRVVAQ